MEFRNTKVSDELVPKGQRTYAKFDPQLADCDYSFEIGDTVKCVFEIDPAKPEFVHTPVEKTATVTAG